MANTRNTHSGAARTDETATAQKLGGYVFSEDSEYDLRTISEAMQGIAILVDQNEQGRDAPDMPADYMAAIFRTLAKATDTVRTAAMVTKGEALVRSRNLH